MSKIYWISAKAWISWFKVSCSCK